jgi:hypothetical protein
MRNIVLANAMSFTEDGVRASGQENRYVQNVVFERISFALQNTIVLLQNMADQSGNCKPF